MMLILMLVTLTSNNISTDLGRITVVIGVPMGTLSVGLVMVGLSVIMTNVNCPEVSSSMMLGNVMSTSNSPMWFVNGITEASGNCT